MSFHKEESLEMRHFEISEIELNRHMIVDTTKQSIFMAMNLAEDGTTSRSPLSFVSDSIPVYTSTVTSSSIVR